MKKIKAVLILVYLRLKSTTPKFFKAIFVVNGGIGALGLTLQTFELPKAYEDWPKILMVIGAVGAFVSKLTTTDPQLQKINTLEAIKDPQ